MIEEALALPMHEREQLAAAAGFMVLAKVLMERHGFGVEESAYAAMTVLDEQMGRMLKEGWKYRPE